MQFSESFYITVTGAGISLAALLLWYTKSTLMTSRCREVICCWGACRIQNDVLDGDDLVEVVQRESPPPTFSAPGNNESRRDFTFRSAERNV